MPEADIMEREIRGGLLMLIVSAIAIASSVGAMYGLSRSGEGFSNIESNTQNVADDLRSVSLFTQEGRFRVVRFPFVSRGISCCRGPRQSSPWRDSSSLGASAGSGF